jgi:iron complex transport system permease protein
MLKGFVLWGMGSFAGVPLFRLAWLAIPVILSIAGALLLIKPLNAWLLGEDHCSQRRGERLSRAQVDHHHRGCTGRGDHGLLRTDRFLGLATPHVVRAFIRTGDHARLMPATILCGAVLALFCDLIVRNSGPETPLPLNAVTSLLGRTGGAVGAAERQALGAIQLTWRLCSRPTRSRSATPDGSCWTSSIYPSNTASSAR